MIHHPSGAQSILLTISLVGLLGVQGCTSAPRYPDERPVEIRLPDPGVTTDLDAFRAQYANAYRGPLHRHERRAICSRPVPPGVGCIAKVTIQARGGSDDISPDKPVKAERVIGVIRNLDEEDITEMYSLKPASQVEYLITIDNGSDGLPRWNRLEVPVGRRGVIRRTPGKKVTRCPGEPPHKYAPYSDLDFRNCGEHPDSPTGYRAGLIGTGGVGSLLLKFVSHFRPSPVVVEPGEWISCPPGCCI